MTRVRIFYLFIFSLKAYVIVYRGVLGTIMQRQGGFFPLLTLVGANTESPVVLAIIWGREY